MHKTPQSTRHTTHNLPLFEYHQLLNYSTKETWSISADGSSRPNYPTKSNSLFVFSLDTLARS